MDDTLYRSLVRGFEFVPPLTEPEMSPLTPAHPLDTEFARWAEHRGVALPANLVDSVRVPRGIKAFTWDAQAVSDTTGHVHVLVGVDQDNDLGTGITPADLATYFGLLLSYPPFVRPVHALAPSLYAFDDPDRGGRVPGAVVGARWHDEDETEWFVLVEVPDAPVDGLPVHAPAMVRFIRPPLKPAAPPPPVDP
jgi:hypothetical protein